MPIFQVKYAESQANEVNIQHHKATDFKTVNHEEHNLLYSSLYPPTFNFLFPINLRLIAVSTYVHF